jgi:hypothetical protein
MPDHRKIYRNTLPWSPHISKQSRARWAILHSINSHEVRHEDRLPEGNQAAGIPRRHHPQRRA